MILFPSFLGSPSKKVEYLSQLRTPIILCGSSGSELKNISYVKCDNRLGSYTAIRHLVDIGCIFPVTDEQQYKSRLIGYQDALRDHGIPFRNELIRVCTPDNDSIFQATLTLLKEEKPDGIFCLYDYSAITVMRAVFCAGLRIPEDIAIIAGTITSRCPAFFLCRSPASTPTARRSVRRRRRFLYRRLPIPMNRSGRSF